MTLSPSDLAPSLVAPQPAFGAAAPSGRLSQFADSLRQAMEQQGSPSLPGATDPASADPASAAPLRLAQADGITATDALPANAAPQPVAPGGAAQATVDPAPAAPAEFDPLRAASAPQAPVGAVEADNRAAAGLGLAAPQSSTPGESILGGLERLRGIFDARLDSVSSQLESPEMSAQSLVGLQTEVMQYTLLVDVSSKLAGKSTQAMDSLMKGQ